MPPRTTDIRMLPTTTGIRKWDGQFPSHTCRRYTASIAETAARISASVLK